MNVAVTEIKEILKQYKKITVLGLSPDAAKPSHKIPLFMKSKGYDIVGVYPGVKEIEGIKIYESLADVPIEYRKFVNVFRKPEHIPAIVEEVNKVGGVDILWLQLGITHFEAEKTAENSGLRVVSNRCLLVEYQRYFED